MRHSYEYVVQPLTAKLYIVHTKNVCKSMHISYVESPAIFPNDMMKIAMKLGVVCIYRMYTSYKVTYPFHDPQVVLN